MKKKKILRVFIALISLFLLVFISYLAYLFFSYHRLPDNQAIEIKKAQQITNKNNDKKKYKITTFNIGYAANPHNYSFFMDGGKYARGFSKENVEQNLAGIIKQVKQTQADFVLLQEVDSDATRSYHIPQEKHIMQAMPEMNAAFALNYDSAYLFYPFTEPIGKSQSGLLTLSRETIHQSTRYQLPIETNLNKFTDYDRAFTISLIATRPKPLALINVHLSAFTKDQSIQATQIKKLAKYMRLYQQKGYGVIVGGDYNHDVLGDTPSLFGTKKQTLTWTHPFPKDALPTGFTLVNQDIVAAKIPSVRANDRPFTKDSYVNLVDGFIVSEDIQVNHLKVWDHHFQYSDHNPVTMTFEIK
ncbi:endonuclease/exonuclease/phosphatase family protein [Enterococcus cecorum]